MRVPVLKLSTTPGHLIRRAQQAHNAIWARHVGTELTSPQYGVLVALAREPLIDQTRLCELVALDKNTAADIVRRLSGRGWISRPVDDRDRRRRVLSLTGQARAALTYITPAARLVQQDLMEPVPRVSRPALIESLATVAYQLGGPVPDPGTDNLVLDMPRSPGYLIRRSQRVHGIIWARHVGTELTGPQYAVLSAVAQCPAADQVTIGALASLDKNSAADVVGRLARDGWLRRDTQPGNERRTMLTLTPFAQARLPDVTPLVAGVQRELLSPLTQADAQLLTDGLALIAYRGTSTSR